MTKAEVREFVRLKLSRLTNRDLRSVRVVEHIRDLLSGGFQVCGAFRPLANEPDITPLFGLEESRTWAFPRIVGDQLEYWVPFGPFTQNTLGVEEPDPKMSRKVALDDLECIIVPGLAFDRKGQRLGRGKGYYDRTLAHFKGLKIGVCFSEQFLKTPLRVEPHDVSVDWIVTEKFVYKPI